MVLEMVMGSDSLCSAMETESLEMGSGYCSVTLMATGSGIR